MIVWRGKGFVIAIATGVCLLASDWLTSQRFHDTEYYASHGWPKLAAFLTAAAIVGLLSIRNRDESIGVDMSAPREPFLADADSLFFVPARHWPVILCVLGLVFYFVRD